jgi:hypothetical protein
MISLFDSNNEAGMLVNAARLWQSVKQSLGYVEIYFKRVLLKFKNKSLFLFRTQGWCPCGHSVCPIMRDFYKA